MLANIRSPQTIANLGANPAIETNVVDPILRRGYRFRGRATVHEDGEVYERGLALFAERGVALTPEQIRNNGPCTMASSFTASMLKPCGGPSR